MNFNVNVGKLKKEIAFIDSNDLLDSLKRNVDYLKHHNKNTTKTQDNAIDVLYAFINSLSETDEHTTSIGQKVCVMRTIEGDDSGSIKGMKEKYYGKNALLVQCGSYIYKVPQRIYDMAK